MADFSGVWETDSEATATATSLDEGDTVAEQNQTTNGPLTAQVETSNWTMQDVEIALQVANLVIITVWAWVAIKDTDT
jgi:hypothetical protein